jgi:hypothetical protein
LPSKSAASASRIFTLLFPDRNIAELKAKYAKIRKANQALIAATLERLFSSGYNQNG